MEQFHEVVLGSCAELGDFHTVVVRDVKGSNPFCFMDINNNKKRIK